jgi:hypothetical protein
MEEADAQVDGPLCEAEPPHAFSLGIEKPLHHAPQGVAGQPQREKHQETLVQGPLLEGLEGPGCVLGIAMASKSTRDGQDPDHPEERTPGGVSEAGKTVEPGTRYDIPRQLRDPALQTLRHGPGPPCASS